MAITINFLTPARHLLSQCHWCENGYPATREVFRFEMVALLPQSGRALNLSPDNAPRELFLGFWIFYIIHSQGLFKTIFISRRVE